ncbi:hypothetical protein QJS66_23550 (plasmid) [Kocuria rhizophila]|nr:hypothetical protein QJS66_23550 [Kocuria rhizophila]
MEPTEAADKVQKNQDPSYYVQCTSYADAVIKQGQVDPRSGENDQGRQGGQVQRQRRMAEQRRHAQRSGLQEGRQWNGDLGSGE